MDEFVDWDASPSAMGTGTGTGTSGPNFLIGQNTATSALDDMDLVLGNVDGDDFSFWALEHFESTNPAGALETPLAGPAGDQIKPFDQSFELPEIPCGNCQRSNYACKRINEGKFKGYCTSCVALRCECSFGFAPAGPAETATTFPANPWPTFGDHPRRIPQEDIQPDLLQSPSVQDLIASTTAAAGSEEAGNKTTGAKIGTRFSRDSVKILKNWLSTHSRHPYPTEEEKEMLQKQTGLNKTQITNWLANARRRGKIVAPRSVSPGVRTFSKAIDIPQRRGTPSVEHMKPLDRWKNSPPEHEPASVTDIARAIASSTTTLSSSGLESPYSGHFTDDGSNRSLWAGSTGASSAHTSHSSGGSFASAFSHASRGSFGSYGSMSLNRGRRRRRRKAAPKRPDEKTPLQAPLKTFQCTFCTETFRTKHDWQRHEKSLHLSLERWVCAPDGPRALDPETNRVSCVFCGQANPDDAHVEGHNHSACQERSLEERTFYRKDHLRQHLKLVHGSKFMTWSMEPWKVATPEIRSRCGFCGIVMDTWTIRVDHLADHFKTGNTMADWKGDWGFEAPVLEMVENSIPPYLIHDERNSPLPYEATRAPPESPASAYELLKLELLFYMWNFQETSDKMPTDEQLQLEACRIIYGADILSKKDVSTAPSWLRDLLLSSENVAQQAKMAPIRRHNDSRIDKLRINGKDNIFEDDPMERQLREYVNSRNVLGLTSLDTELQDEACNILGRLEEMSGNASDEIANFLVRLVLRSTDWLSGFRKRTSLPRSEDIMDVNTRSKDPMTIDSTIHNYSRLEAELSAFARACIATGSVPSDADLQAHARQIIYDCDDPWNQTAADNANWLAGFKQRHLHLPSVNSPMNNSPSSFGPAGSYPLNQPSNSASPSSALTGIAAAPTPGSNGSGSAMPPVKLPPFFLNDANCFRRLARELSRWVASTMSPNNPSCHIPTDEEIQHQARWILYDSDDTWNQTAADNAEWLQRFKKDVGIISDPSVPGLPDGIAWNIYQGGSGFAPPYAMPNQNATIALAPSPESSDRLPVQITAGPEVAKMFDTDTTTVNKYIQSLAQGRLPPPATVFCSRELENGLVKFVTDQTAPFGLGEFPSDEELRGKAREILGTQTTSADDPALLEKFKTMIRERLSLDLGAPTTVSTSTGGGSLSQGLSTAATTSGSGSSFAHSQSQNNQSQLSDGLAGMQIQMPLPGLGDNNGGGAGMDLVGLTDGQLNDILGDMDFQFGDLEGLDGNGGLGNGFGM
ncbi:C2H2 type zinc finger-containing protein [Coniochaeta sp. 2T2.1]|nr:C2H2 type zinc finger-containing protein [Coniochaeta sp. 2T2.1]